MINQRNYQNELKTLRSIFLEIEEQVFQLEKRERNLKEKLGRFRIQ